MKKFIIAFILNCFWAFVLMQRLCSEKSPSDREPISCCQRLPSPVDSGINQACVTNYSKNTQKQLEETKDGVPKGNCVAECIANRTNIYRGNGIIDKVNLARIFLNTVSGEKEWGDIVSGAVDVCISETRQKADELRLAANMKATFAGEIICHPISGYLLGCMSTEMFKRCPNMTDSVECSELRLYAANCHLPVKYDA